MTLIGGRIETLDHYPRCGNEYTLYHILYIFYYNLHIRDEVEYSSSPHPQTRVP